MGKEKKTKKAPCIITEPFFLGAIRRTCRKLFLQKDQVLADQLIPLHHAHR